MKNNNDQMVKEKAKGSKDFLKILKRQKEISKHQLILSYHYYVLKYTKQTKMWLMISDLSCHTKWLDYIATFHSAKQSISKIWDTSSCKLYLISTIYIY